MHRILFSFALIIAIHSTLNAQKRDTLGVNRDTIALHEVKVVASFALNNNDLVDFYRTHHFATLDQINARLSGMSLIKRGAYALEPQLNGFSGGQINVTIDGMRMFGACTDKMDPITSYIEPTNLNSISIRQGSNGAINGSTIGGTIDFSLIDPNTNRKEGSTIGFGYEGVSKGKTVLFSTGAQLKKWAFGIEGVFRKNENYRTGHRVEVPFSQYQKINLHGSATYTLSKENRIKVDFLYDNGSNVGYPALPMDVSRARASLFAIDYKKKGRVSIQSKLYSNSVQHIMDDSQRDSLFILKNNPVGKPDSVFMRMDMPGVSKTLGAYFIAKIPTGKLSILTLKAENYTNYSLAEMTMHMRFVNAKPEAPMYLQTWPEMMRNVSGIYAEESWAIQKGSISLNGRLDYTSDFSLSEVGKNQFAIFNYTLKDRQSRLTTNANINLSYSFSKQFSSDVSIGYGERVPTISERLGFYLFNAYDGFDYIGDPEIKNEKSFFTKVQGEYTTSYFKANFTQTLSIVQDYILGVTDPSIPQMNFYAQGIRRYTNLPQARLMSSDLQLAFLPSKRVTLFLLSKYTYGEMADHSPLPLIAPLKSILSAQYKFKRLSFQGECEGALKQTRINAQFGETMTNGFAIINLKSSYSLPLRNSKIDVSISITNLLNRGYYEHLDWGKIDRPGRSIDLYTSLHF